MTAPILTKYISSCVYNETAVSKAFLELVDECIWCWYLEALEILKVLSIEEMDISTLVAYFEAYNVKFRSYDDKDINRYSLIHWFNIMHSRGLTKTMESVLSINGEVSGGEISVDDITLYNPPEVPYDIVSNPKDGFIYAVTKLDTLDVKDNSLLNQVTPAGYRIIIIKQTPPDILYSCTSINTNRYFDRCKKIPSCVSIFNSSIKEKTTTNYKSPQFTDAYNFTQLYNKGYSVNVISELNSKYNIFSFDIAVEEHEEFIISGTFVDNENIYITEDLKDTTFEKQLFSFKTFTLSVNNECYGDKFIIGKLHTKPVIPFEPDEYNGEGGNFQYYYVIDELTDEPVYIYTEPYEYMLSEPIYIINDFIIGGRF